MKELPEEICKLFKLQTLMLWACYELKKLPPMLFIELKSLRHLLTDSESMEYPQGLGGLIKLRSLSTLIIEKGKPTKLGCLKYLNKLGGVLHIFLKGLNGESDMVEATDAAMQQKEYIEFLHLVYDENVSSDVLEALRPPSSLWGLECHGAFLPRWISTITYLRRLVLCETYWSNGNSKEGEASIPPLWKLLHLEELSLVEISGLERLGREFIGLNSASNHALIYEENIEVFPKLKKLVLSECPHLREWLDLNEEEAAAAEAGHIKIFPCLRRLDIYGYKRGMKLPLRILQHVVVSSLTFEACLGIINLELSCDAGVLPDVLQTKRPPRSLENLLCAGLIYPRWISAHTYLRKVELMGHIEGGGREASIPPLWKLPFLEELFIRHIPALKYLGREFLGISGEANHELIDANLGDGHQQHLQVAFPLLHKLTFHLCPSWRQWEDISNEDAEAVAAGRFKIMQQILSLTISGCFSLEALPHRLLKHIASSLKYLNIRGSHKLLSLYQPYRDNWDEISHIPDIIF